MSSASAEARPAPNTPASGGVRIAPLQAATYKRHLIHGENRTWAETNCYADLVIELVHGFGFEPIAMLPFTVGIDFEGDQWTFFKPPHGDLYQLYGMDVQELAIWRPLVDHVVEQVAARHPVMVELDSFYLPDTAGTAYKIARTKSTVGVNEIDVDRRFMGYFHNAGYFELQGEDFRDVFQTEGLAHERMLPPYVEFIKWRRDFTAPRGKELVDASLGILKRHLTRVPLGNPFERFRERLVADLDWLMKAEIERFHAYSFATLRQYGACFELAETYVRWLGENGIAGLDEVADDFKLISESAKSHQFQLARSMARKKPLDLAPLEAMGARWAHGMGALQARFG